MPTELQSHSLGGVATGSQAASASSEAFKLISSCPHLDVDMGGVRVPCLVDTGSMVSISESFFRQHFEPWGQERLPSCHWLQLRAANGLEIPYIGYLELEVHLCGKWMSHYGVLVLKDSPGGVSSQVPGVLGMNIIRKCYQELFGQPGAALSFQPCVCGYPRACCAGTAAVPSC